MQFPAHKASLHLTHNEHLAVYKTVQDAINGGDFGTKDEDWISPEQKQKAIDTNEWWLLQWYPDTPIGSYTLSSAELEPLLKAACAI